MCLHCEKKGCVIEFCQIKMRGDRVRVSLAAKESEIDPTQFTIYIVITETLAFSAANSRLSLIFDSEAIE